MQAGISYVVFITTLLCEMNTFTHVREMGDRSLYVSLQQESLQSELVNVFMLMEVMKALTKMPVIYVAQVLLLL